MDFENSKKISNNTAGQCYVKIIYLVIKTLNSTDKANVFVDALFHIVLAQRKILTEITQKRGPFGRLQNNLNEDTQKTCL